jgi:hypothetical protein
MAKTLQEKLAEIRQEKDAEDDGSSKLAHGIAFYMDLGVKVAEQAFGPEEAEEAAAGKTAQLPAPVARGAGAVAKAAVRRLALPAAAGAAGAAGGAAIGHQQGVETGEKREKIRGIMRDIFGPDIYLDDE